MPICRECLDEYTAPPRDDDGFCSDSCMDDFCGPDDDDDLDCLNDDEED